MNFTDAYQWINLRFLLKGLIVTLEVAALTITFSILLGNLLGILRYLKIPGFSQLLGLVIDTIRNLPLLLIIFFTYFALPRLGVHFNPFWSTIVAMTVFESCMVSEIIRGGLQAIPLGQTEAGLASAFTPNETLRYILLPQAVRQTLPSVVSQLIALIKDTSLATVITLPELMHSAQIVYGQNNNYVIPMFMLLALYYFIICYSLSLFARYLQKRYRY
ncbi:amino acid ABC transporter permease [Vaginisenegalia massiliensis]|uniref:amino acid ABC transporter permease n=1 Tax=Vaginisenegalia massiliensis TaxID=2058294 RepID=UPI000F526972|nr:amino acid ABC transporter permease [Vaginisenegalia massiliensis]